MLRTIKLYEELSYFESSADFASELEALYADLQGIRNELDRHIARLVGNLHAQILNDKLEPKSGIFNGIKQWWSNLFGGHKKKSNPYYWQNKLGALGRTDIEPPTVGEYRMLNNLANSLVEAVQASPQPLITRILNNWSAQLRNVIQAHMDGMLSRVKKSLARVGGSGGGTLPPAAKLPEPPKPVKDPIKKPDVVEPDPIDPAKLKPDPAVEDDDEVDDEEVDDPADEFPEPASTALPSRPEDNIPLVRQLLQKYKGVSIENVKNGTVKLPPEDERIILAVHEPWLSLGPTARKNLNLKGRNGIPLKSNNKGRYPFRIPPVLRLKDPRIDIMKVYYPELYRDLDHSGRIEHEGDDETAVSERIRAAIKKGLEEDEFVVPKPTKKRKAEPKRKKEPKRKTEPTPKPKPRSEPEHKAPLGDVDDRADSSSRRKIDKKAPLDPGEIGGTGKDDDTSPPKGEIKKRFKGVPKPVVVAMTKLAESDPDKAHEVIDAWETIKKHKEVHKKFKDYVADGDFDMAIAMKDGGHDDDEAAELFGSHYVPVGPSLAEALVRRLREQREGKAAAWRPAPKNLDPKKLVERLRQQSAKIYEQA